jgi:hypothetical protein
MSEHFCYLALHRDHVNLGFNQGAELPDPEGLLGGPGKTLRHAKISAPEDLESPALRRLFQAAVPHREATRPDRRGGAWSSTPRPRLVHKNQPGTGPGPCELRRTSARSSKKALSRTSSNKVNGPDWCGSSRAALDIKVG